MESIFKTCDDNANAYYTTINVNFIMSVIPNFQREHLPNLKCWDTKVNGDDQIIGIQIF